MGSTIVEIRLKARKEAVFKALVDTGFYGDVITLPRIAEGIGVSLDHERRRTLPDGNVIEVRYGGGEITVLGSVTHGDVEVWDRLKLPEGVDALLGVTALEKLGLKIDPKTGRLEKVEFYLL